MNWGWGAPEADGIDRYWRAPTLMPHQVLFVRVSGFTFEFHSKEQVRATLDFYSRKIQPSGRLSVGGGEYGGDQSETQRWFERLPLYLREEPKRKEVVKALERAMREY